MYIFFILFVENVFSEDHTFFRAQSTLYKSHKIMKTVHPCYQVQLVAIVILATQIVALYKDKTLSQVRRKLTVQD